MAAENRIAVVGYGSIGRRHAKVIRQTPGVTLAGVVEPNRASGESAHHIGVPVFDSLGELFAGQRPDGVVLATPTPLHVEQGLECVTRRCPVLIEKPISVTAADAVAVTDAAAAAEVPLLVGHHRRHSGMVQAAKQSLDAGDIGEIRSVQATCWFFKPDRYFDEAPWRKCRGAGPISVNLVHDVDLLRHFCGEVSMVQAVALPSQRGFENEDLATAVLTFRSGTVASISVSDSIVAPWSWELTARENPAYPATSESCYLIGGSRGAMSLPDLRLWRHGGEPDWWTPISAMSLTCGFQDPLVTQMLHFSEVIDGKATPMVSGTEGIRSLEVVEAIKISAASGRTVELDAEDISGRG